MSVNASIRFTRKNQGASGDDVILMRPAGMNVSITHIEGEEKRKYTLVLTETSLSRYIDTMLRLARNDTDPFYSVQINLPGFPAFMFTMDRLQNSEVLRAVREAAWTVQDSWTRHLPFAEASSDAESESSTDSESTTSSEATEEVTDEDMPPLIPVQACPRRRSARLNPPTSCSGCPWQQV